MTRIMAMMMRRYAYTTAGIGLLVMSAAACSPSGSAQEQVPGAVQVPPLEIGRENTLRVERGEIVVGPIVSGTLAPRVQATVRAEVGGSVLAVTAEQGQSVRRGDVLARIETRTQAEVVSSAESAVRSDEQALAQTRRELERAESLVRAGAIAERDVENLRNAVVSAESRLADARSRLSSARRVLDDATVLSPIAGIVSERPVSMGDVVAPGAALYTIVDPSSMELEASVPSESLSAVRAGAAVQFTVRGYPDQTFTGRVERISPTADPVTRQVPIWVSVDNRGGRLVGGLYAEGRVTQQARTGLVLPLAVVTEEQGQATVLRVTEGVVDRVGITLGLRDPQTEQVEILSGLQAGDVVLRGVAQGITPGTRVALRAGHDSAAADDRPPTQ
jgi:membrane fusion protein, multidrug efflux system